MSVNCIKYISGPGGELIPIIIEEVVQDDNEQPPQCSYAVYHEIDEDDGNNNGEGAIMAPDASLQEEEHDLGNAGNIIIDSNGGSMTLQQLIECSVMEEVETVESHDDTQHFYDDSNYEEQQGTETNEDGNENDIIFEIEPHLTLGTFKQFEQSNVPPPNGNCASYFCPHCGNCYTAPGSLKLHIRACLRTRTEVPPEDRQCKNCKKVFNSVSYLKDHMLTHTDTKLYRCQRCYRKFVDEYKFNTHIESHQQQDKLDAAAAELVALHGGGKKIVKEYNCSFCSCMFMVAFDVGEVKKRYACDDCREKYSNKEALLQHKEKNSTKREFACNRCGRRFIFEGFLQRHQPNCDGTIKRRGGAKS